MGLALLAYIDFLQLLYSSVHEKHPKTKTTMNGAEISNPRSVVCGGLKNLVAEVILMALPKGAADQFKDVSLENFAAYR